MTPARLPCRPDTADAPDEPEESGTAHHRLRRRPVEQCRRACGVPDLVPARRKDLGAEAQLDPCCRWPSD